MAEEHGVFSSIAAGDTTSRYTGSKTDPGQHEITADDNIRRARGRRGGVFSSSMAYYARATCAPRADGGLGMTPAAAYGGLGNASFLRQGERVVA